MQHVQLTFFVTSLGSDARRLVYRAGALPFFSEQVSKANDYNVKTAAVAVVFDGRAQGTTSALGCIYYGRAYRLCISPAISAARAFEFPARAILFGMRGAARVVDKNVRSTRQPKKG